MTAMNVVLTKDAAHLFTDGAIVEIEEGKVVGIGSKPAMLPHLNAVLMSTGYHYVNFMLSGAIIDSRVSSFDELAEHFGSIVRKAVQEAKGLPSAVRNWGFFETVIVGYSESTNRPRAYAMSRGFGGLQTEVIITKQSISPYLEEGRSLPEPTGDVEADGLTLMEMQRETLLQTRDAPDLEIYGVGGFCQHTKVTRDGISTKVLKRWPDLVGGPIVLEKPSPSLFGPA